MMMIDILEVQVVRLSLGNIDRVELFESWDRGVRRRASSARRRRRRTPNNKFL